MTAELIDATSNLGAVQRPFRRAEPAIDRRRSRRLPSEPMLLSPASARFSAASSRSTSRPGSRSARGCSSSAPGSRCRRRRCAASSRSSRRSGCSPIRTRRRGACRPRTGTACTPRSSSRRSRAGRTASASTCASMRDEIEDALRATTDMLSHATRLLALVSAPSLETASIRHVEVLALQPTSVMVVVITSTGGVTKRVFRLERPVDQGLVAWASRVPERALVGRAARLELGSSSARRSGARAARARVSRADRPGVCSRSASEEGPEVFVGGAAGLLEEARAEEVEATMRLARAARAARGGAGARERGARAAAPGRPRRPRGRRRPAPRRVARRRDLRDPPTPLGAVGLIGPLRMDYEKAIRTVRAAAFELSPLRRGRLRRGLIAAWRRPSATTTRCSALRGRRATPRSRRRFARSRGSSIPTSRARRTRSGGSARSPRRTRCSPIRSARATYDRFGQAGLRRGGFEPRSPTSGTSRTSSPRSSARISSGARGARVRHRAAATSRRWSRSISTRPSPGSPSPSRRGRGAVRALRTRAARSPARGSRSCPTCGGAGVVRRVSQNMFGQFVQQQTCPDCGGVGRGPRARRAATAAARAGSSLGASSRSTCRRGSTTASGSVFAARVTPGSGERARRRVRRRPRAPDPRFVRDGDDLHTAVRLTMTEAALGTTARVAGCPGASSTSRLRRHAAWRRPRHQGAGDAVAAGLAARRSLRPARRRRADAADRGAASAARGLRPTGGARDLRAAGRRGRGVLSPPEERACAERPAPRRDPRARRRGGDRSRPAAAARAGRVRGGRAGRAGSSSRSTWTRRARAVLRGAFDGGVVTRRSRRAGRTAGARSIARSSPAGSGSARPGSRRRPASRPSSSTRGARSGPARMRRRERASSCSPRLERGSLLDAGLRVGRGRGRGGAARIRAGLRDGQRSGRGRGGVRHGAPERRRRSRSCERDVLTTSVAGRRARRRQHRARRRRGAARAAAGADARVTSGYLVRDVPSGRGLGAGLAPSSSTAGRPTFSSRRESTF